MRTTPTYFITLILGSFRLERTDSNFSINPLSLQNTPLLAVMVGLTTIPPVAFSAGLSGFRCNQPQAHSNRQIHRRGKKIIMSGAKRPEMGDKAHSNVAHCLYWGLGLREGRTEF
jgi:hypothetical protein